MEKNQKFVDIEGIIAKEYSEKQKKRLNKSYLKDRLHNGEFFLWPDFLNSYGSGLYSKMNLIIKTKGLGKGVLGRPVAVIGRDAFGNYIDTRILRKNAGRYYQIIEGIFKQYEKKSGEKCPVYLY